MAALGAGLSFFQPLDPAQRYFVEAGLKYERGSLNTYQNNERVAQYNNANTALGLWAGMNIGIMGQARLSFIEQRRTFERDIDFPLLPNFDTSYSAWAASCT